MKKNTILFIWLLVSYSFSSVQIVGGQITGDIYWTTDTIIIESDIYDLIYSQANLNITSSTIIMEYGSKLTIFGSISATGTEFLMEDGENISIKGEAFPIDSSIFIDCRFIAGESDSGGAISFIQSSKNRIENCYFENNSAAFGGAISLFSSSAKIVNCLFEQNNAYLGASIHATNNSLVRIDNTKFIAGRALDYGGAIYTDRSELFFRNCFFIDNSSGLSGGAVWSDYSTSRFVNCTFYKNESRGASSIYAKEADVQNCLFAGQSQGTSEVEIPDDFFNTFRNNFVEDGSGPSDVTNLSGDPKVGKDLFLLFDSPCIDKGTTNMGEFNGMNFPSIDYEGRDRIVEATVDIGAIEYDGIHNVGPIINHPIEDQAVHSNTEFNFTIPDSTFYDTDGDSIYCYVPGSLPSWLSFDIPTKTFTGTPINHSDSTFNIVVSFDDVDHFVYDTFSLHVINTPLHVLNPIPNQEVNNNSEYYFIIPDSVFYDAEDNITRYRLVSNPSWLTFSEYERLLHGTPVNQKDSIFEVIVEAQTGVKVLVWDPNWGPYGDWMETFEFAQDTFLLHVVNEAPIVLNPLPDVEVHSNDTLLVILPDSTFYDPDDTLHYVAVESPAWLHHWYSTHEQEHSFFGVPENSRDTTYCVILKAASIVPENTVNDTFFVHVINDAPIVLNPIPDQEVHSNDTLVVTVPDSTFYDPDDTLHYVVVESPAWLYHWFSTIDGEHSFYGVPENSRDTTYRVILKAASIVPENTVNDTFFVHVINDAPIVLNPIPDQEVHSNDTLVVTVPDSTFYDPDDTLHYVVVESPAWLYHWFSTIDGEHSFYGVPENSRDTTYRVILKAASIVPKNTVNDTFFVHVINDAPIVLNPIPDQEVHSNDSLEVILPDSTFYDPDDTLHYVVVESPAWLYHWFSTIDGEHSFYGVPENSRDTTYRVILKAASIVPENIVNDTFFVHVINDVPDVSNSLPDHIIINNSEFNFIIPDSTFHDNESDVTLNPQNLPDWLSFNVQNNAFSGIPYVHEDTSFSIIVNAYDDVNQRVSDTFMISVEIPNGDPVITSVNDTTIIVGAYVTWQINAFDSDYNDTLYFSLIEYPVNMTIDENNGFIEWFGDENYIGVNTVVIQVIDNNGGMSLDTFEVTVDYPVKKSNEVINQFSKRIKIAPNPVETNTDFIVFYFDSEAIIQGKYGIYDLVGNLLHSYEFISDRSKIIGKWDLTNQNHRKISSGTYSVIFTVYQDDGSIIKIKKLIGVKESF